MSAQVQLSHFKRAFSEMSDSTPDSSFNTSCSVEASSQSLTFTSDGMKRFKLSSPNNIATTVQPISTPHLLPFPPSYCRSIPLESLPYNKHLAESKQLRDEMKAKTVQNGYYEDENTQALSYLTTPVFQTAKKTKERKYTASEVQKLIDEAVQLHDAKIREEFAITLNRVIKGKLSLLIRTILRAFRRLIDCFSFFFYQQFTAFLLFFSFFP